MQKSFDKFDDIISYFEHFTNLEKNPNDYSSTTYRLDKMQALLKSLGNPEKNFKAIHVAGSKGKGSTSAMLANAIQSLGYKCGLYASPHLIDYRERFTLAGHFFEDSLLIKTGNQMADFIENLDFSTLPGGTCPTVFELFTAYSYLLFNNAGCQYAVIETGLGGRLDATNTLNPIACVLTPIELEHTAILGDTITKIAVEKSKIIKPDTPCFISFQRSADAERIFAEEAHANNSPSYFLKDYVNKIETSAANGKQHTKVFWTDGKPTELKLNMLGKVQADNAALALLTLKKTDLYKEGLSEKAVENTTLPGRFEKIMDNPPFYIDGAHTVASVSNLIATFSELYPNKNNTVIFGCLPDKKVEEITALIISNFDNIIVSKPGTFKKNNPVEVYNLIKSKIQKTDKRLILLENASEAIAYAIKITPKDCAILTTGSFYLAGDIKKSALSLKSY